jgi:hypothetical protein
LKKRLFIAGIILLWLSTLAIAQEQKSSQVGIGINFYAGNQNLVAIPEGLSSIYITTSFGGNFRIEPEIGFSSYSWDYDSGNENNLTILRIGLGQFYVTNWQKSVRLFVGPRFGLVRSWRSRSSPYTDYPDENASSVFFSLCTGAEYELAQRFTIGGELQLGYIDYGKIQDDDPDETLIYHNALFTLRWYFK